MASKEFYQKTYPKGTRVEIIDLCNPEPFYPAGTRGTVKYVDDALQIHVTWDNGGSIALLPEEGDIFKIIS